LEDIMKNLTAQLRFGSLLSLILLAWMTTATTAYAQITPLGDSFTNTADPTTNFGATTLLDVDGATQITYIQFNLASIPTTASVSQATLKLYVNSVTTAGSFNVDYVNGTWAESTIDASNEPALGKTIASDVAITTADKNQYILINVTSAVQAWLNGSEKNDGIALVANSTFNASFDSKESTTTSHSAELDIAFAGGDGTITGVTTGSGGGLTGGGTSGTLNLSLTTSCAANQVLEWNGTAWACANPSGTGTITGVTAGTDLTGGGTGGKVTLNLNTAALNSAYAQLAVANTFAPQQVIKGNGGNAIIGDPGCGAGFSGIGLTSSTLSGCSNYTMIGKSSGDVYVNSISSGAIHFRNTNSGTNLYNDLATIDNLGNLTAAGTVAASSSNVGVYGTSAGASATGSGFGTAGVWGDSGGGGTEYIGILGTADSGRGGFFVNNSEVDAALGAENDNTTSEALAFFASGNSGSCTIDIDGDLGCSGTVSGVVNTDHGSRKVGVYSMQSAENWFEDAGSGQLANGSAHIALDSTFAQTVNTGVEYHIFLTPEGDCEGLYVTNKTAQGFDVHELRGGHSAIAFDYRIMAKRAGYENVRLPDLTERYQKLEQQQLKLRQIRSAQRAKAAATPMASVSAALHK
jgi:hypothetical protein